MRNPIPALIDALALAGARIAQAADNAVSPAFDDPAQWTAMPEGVQPLPADPNPRELTPHEALLQVGREIAARAAPDARIQIGPLDVS